MRHLSLMALSCLVAAVSVAASPGRVHAQVLQTSVYGSVNYQVSGGSHQKTTNSFAVPTVDFFFRGEAEKFTLISELVFDIPEGNTFEVDIDRLVVSYDFSQAFRLSAGRFHTSMGYFNTAYPHGAAIFLLSVDRPLTVSQFDEQALLPALGIGVHAGGRIHLGRETFAYDLDVLNGRGSSAAELTNSIDHNNQKAFNLRLRYEPGFLSGAIIGGNAYFDDIAPAPADPGTMISPQPLELHEQIFGVHLAYTEFPLHFIGEGYVIQHRGGGETFTTLAAFLEVGFSVGAVTPYAREELAEFPASPDPFYALTRIQARGDLQATSAGVKWAFYDYLAFKVELEWDHSEANSIYLGTLQAAFGY
jgi:hypothetical protein